MGRFRIDLLQGLSGAFALLAGLLMLMEPHRLVRFAAFAPLQPYFHLAGSLFLIGGVLLIGRMVARPRRDGTTPLAAVLAFALSLAVATPIVAAFAIDAARDDAETRAHKFEDTQDAAALISEMVAGAITNQQTIAISVASGTDLLSLPPDDVHRRLTSRATRQPTLRALAVFRADGTPLGRSDDAAPRSPAGLPTFQQTVTTQKVHTGLERSLALGRLLVISAAPMLNERGELIGVAAASSEPGQVLASLSNLQIPGARVFLVDEQGVVVATNTDAAIGTQVASPTVLAARERGHEVGTIAYGTGGDEWLTAYQRLPDTGWIVVVERSAATLLADTYAYRDRMLVYLLVAMAVAIVGGVALARRVSAPLIRLAAAVGQFDGRHPSSLPHSTLTEAAELAAAFADAQMRLAARTAEQEASEAEVRRLNQTLEERVRRRTAELAAASADAQRFRALVASSDDAILSKDLRGTVLSWNASAERLYGYAAEEMIGRSVSMLFPADRQHELPELLARVAHGESVEAFDTIRVHQDGRRLDVSVRVSPIRDDDGTVVAVSAIARDLTIEIERQRREIGSEKLRALGQMAGGIAHDLNQSLSLITGYGELLEDALAYDAERPLPPHLAEMLRTIRQAAHDGGETVARLLRFARGGSDSPAIAPEPVHISTLLDEVVRLTAPRWRDASQADGRPIRLDVESAPDVVIQGHPAGLREALTNLVFNAVDALPQGGRIRLVARQRVGGVRLIVEDDGQGMPADVRERIFEPFFTTKGDRGTGLGLAMVQSIVERHRGTITVESALGQGARFVLDFPLAGQPLTMDQPDDEAAPPARGRLRLLLVDDQKGITAMASMMLARHGHAVAQASSGEEAQLRLEAQPFDIVISDVAMGEGINGWQLAAQIHERWPGLPVVLATGWAAGIDPDEATARGIAGVLHKPYRSADLLAMIAAVTASAPAM
ncbi:MAG: PAS domain S-box protein [Chloroflexi bacterium]|nr:PAS domain S-box protein [Chloroflexota bacterium]